MGFLNFKYIYLKNQQNYVMSFLTIKKKKSFSVKIFSLPITRVYFTCILTGINDASNYLNNWKANFFFIQVQVTKFTIFYDEHIIGKIKNTRAVQYY